MLIDLLIRIAYAYVIYRALTYIEALRVTGGFTRIRNAFRVR